MKHRQKNRVNGIKWKESVKIDKAGLPKTLKCILGTWAEFAHVIFV